MTTIATAERKIVFINQSIMGKKTVSLILTTVRSGGTKKRKSSEKTTAKKGRSKNHVGVFGRKTYKRGSFKRYCTKGGFGGANSACIESALKSGSRRRKRQAVLVRTLNRIRPK